MKIKNELPVFIGTTLKACIAVPLVATPLYYLNLNQDYILWISTIVASTFALYLHLKNYNFFNIKSEKRIPLFTGNYDCHFRATDLLMFGAITSEAHFDDFIDSEKLEKIASEIYRSSKL